MAAENYYEVLGLRQGAGDEEIKQAFRELAKTLHPDRNPDDPEAERRFKLVSTAYEALKDDSRRRAYDEWLAFARKHERSKFAQWSRLVAMVVLLLIGPSIALYWAFVLLDTWDKPVARPPVTVAAHKPKPAERTTTIDTRNANAKPETQTISEKQAANPQSAAEEGPQRAPKGDLRSEPVKQETVQPRSQPATEVARSEQPAPTSPNPVARADNPDVTAALPPRDDRSVVPPPVPAPAIPAQPKSVARAEAPAAKTPAKPVEEPAPSVEAPDKTASLPPTVWDGPSRDEEKAASSSPQQEERSASRSDDTPDDAQEGTARSMARVIAESKESIAAPSTSREPITTPWTEPSQDRIQPQATPQPGAAARLAPSQLRGPDDFSDCDRCPVMSVVSADDFEYPRAARGKPPRTLAISKVEVTIAQWNACVQDGFCRGLRNSASGSADKPIQDVTRAEAARYTDWLTRKTGRSYKVMKVGGWENQGRRGDRSEPVPERRARPAFGPEDDCSAPDWDWIEDSDCAKQRRAAARARETAERLQRGDPQPYETTSGFRVSRTLGPDG